MSSFLNTMIHAARLAGAGLRTDFARARELAVREKGASDFVSNADIAAQAVIEKELRRAFPEAALVLEEERQSHALTGALRFYVDPLDGTTNFLHAIPHFSISIACERDAELVAGVVYDVAKDELFAAERGAGAWLNDRRIAVSSESRLDRAVVGTGVPHHGRPAHVEYLSVLPRVMADFGGIRRFGSAALDLAYVAAGRFDAFFESHLSAWDIAAGVVLVREAGGVVVQPDGRDFELAKGHVLASNEALREPLRERLSGLIR